MPYARRSTRVPGDRSTEARRSSRRAGMAAAAVVALAALVSGCATGVDAPTNLQAAPVGGPGDGASTEVGALLGRGLVLVTDEQGNANLVGTLLNVGNDPDALSTVTVDGASGVTISSGASSGAEIDLPARSSRRFGQFGSPQVTVRGLTAPVGRFVRVTLNYRSAGSASTDILTVPAAGPWTGLAPASS